MIRVNATEPNHLARSFYRRLGVGEERGSTVLAIFYGLPGLSLFVAIITPSVFQEYALYIPFFLDRHAVLRAHIAMTTCRYQIIPCVISRAEYLPIFRLYIL